MVRFCAADYRRRISRQSNRYSQNNTAIRTAVYEASGRVSLREKEDHGRNRQAAARDTSCSPRSSTAMSPAHLLGGRAANSSDPLHVAYTAAVGAVARKAPTTRVQGCARCGMQTATMTPVGAVLSRRFTAYENWTNLAGRLLCEVCVWGYRHRPLRTTPHVVGRQPLSFQVADAGVLQKVLLSAVAAGVAVTVPLYPGRKHVLPEAQWGRVTVDDVPLTWLAADGDRLAVMVRLRERGFSEAELREPVPPYQQLRALGGHCWLEVFSDWEALAAWRSAHHWWEVGVRASRARMGSV